MLSHDVLIFVIRVCDRDFFDSRKAETLIFKIKPNSSFAETLIFKMRPDSSFSDFSEGRYGGRKAFAKTQPGNLLASD